MEEKITFETNTFGKRLKSMLKVDFRRLFTTPLFYLVVGICLVMPIIILVMTTMMDGTVQVNPQTEKETVIEGFKNVWQIIGSVSGGEASMSMDLTSMCNINLLYFFIAVVVCLFVGDDFRSGYAKNLFTVRSKKSDYVISKSLVLVLVGMVMVLAFFIGAMLGGAISNLSFALDGATAFEVVMCVLSKMLLMGVFVPIFLTMSVVGKQRTWLSIILSLGVGMLLFTMAPMIAPLNSTIVNVILCLGGGAMFGFGLGALSALLLRKIDILR